MSFIGGTILVLFSVTTAVTAVATALDMGKRGGLFNMFMGVCVGVFGILVAFAIPAQILLDITSDEAAEIQLRFDRNLISTRPDEAEMREELQSLETLSKASGSLRRMEFPDLLAQPKESASP